jgi:hypothetical protein
MAGNTRVGLVGTAIRIEQILRDVPEDPVPRDPAFHTRLSISIHSVF